MKKVLYLLLLFFIPVILKSQTVTEKTIFNFENISEADPYSFSYDEKTGTYLYMLYDSTKTPNNMVLSNKGNTGLYDYIDYFNAVYDANGNYYTVANSKVNDTTFTYFFIKNGKQELQYDFINSDFVVNNGIVYFLCTDKEKSFISSYEFSTGKYSKGKEYDEIVLCEFEKIQYEGEPMGRIGFTKDNKPYYIAKSNNQAFVVVGDAEQKHYADIESYNFVTDKNGNFAYTAKDTGNFMNPGGSFVVYGNKQFKPFYYIYNLTLDKKGNIYYIGTDESVETSPQRIMCGDKALSKTYSGGVYNLGFTQDNKMYFTASEKKKNSEEYVSFVVFDGKEGKKYQSIFNIREMSDNKLLYSAMVNENKAVIVKDDEEIFIDKRSVISAEILGDGSIAYVSAIFGNYETKVKDKYFVNIDEKEFGPYDGLQAINYTTSDYFLSDKNGNYVYILNNNKNYEDYYSVVYWKGGKSDEFDYVQDINLYKGKPIFTSSRTVNKETYASKLKVNYGSKTVTKEYDAINNYKFDEKTGTASFVVTKGNEMVKVEIKF
jgi:hypothetical protein